MTTWPWWSARSSIAVTVRADGGERIARRMGEEEGRSLPRLRRLRTGVRSRLRGMSHRAHSENSRRPAGRPSQRSRRFPGAAPGEISVRSRGLGSRNPPTPPRFGLRRRSLPRTHPRPPRRTPPALAALQREHSRPLPANSADSKGRSPRLSAYPGTMASAGSQRSTVDRASHDELAGRGEIWSVKSRAGSIIFGCWPS